MQSDERALVQILETISRDDALFYCARLNVLITGHSALTPIERQKKAVKWLCNDDEIRKLNSYAQNRDTPNGLTVFFRGQLLELMRWVLLHGKNKDDDGSSFQDPYARRRFFQAALIASKLWSDRLYGNRFTLEGEPDVIRQRALGAFRKGNEESGQAPHLALVVGRGWTLFSKYMPAQIHKFDKIFLSATGLSIEEYYACAVGLVTYVLPEAQGSQIFNSRSVGAKTAENKKIQTFLELESQSPENLALYLQKTFSSSGYRAIRERPILTVSDDRSIMLDPKYYGEKLSIGPLFHLLQHGSIPPNELFGAFGKAFESYAADALRRMYPTGAGILINRLNTNVIRPGPNGPQFEVDALLNDVTDLVVFEMKAAWLREDKMLSEDYADFVSNLRQKYGAMPANSLDSKERPKGIAQLARIIRAVAKREWLGERGELSTVEVIYPVLVVHDDELSAPGFGSFLNEEFKKLLEPIELSLRVHPLTVMTISDLEILETSVNEFGLRELLAAYTQAYPDRTTSLHNFIATSSYASKILANTTLLKVADDLMEATQSRLFPGT